jgi:hypothetical protein
MGAEAATWEAEATALAALVIGAAIDNNRVRDPDEVAGNE